jgi:hypothetical protein
LPFTSRQLQLIVREPYLEARREVRPVPIELDSFTFEPPESLALLSKMEDARLYLDGPFRQMPVGLGDRVTCGISNEPLHVFGLGRRRLATLSPIPASRGQRASARAKKRRKSGRERLPGSA